MLRSRFLLATVVALTLLLAPTIRAQENATITGTVVDPSGAVVPNASISLTNPATGQVRQTVSNNDGIYLFANVGVGNFTLSATASGFVNFSRTGIVVNTG
jgi:hypothetical protein